MERVIVTIERYNDRQSRDVEIPGNLSADVLLREIPPAFGWGNTYEIYADPPGRVLASSETLFQAGVWDGARLIFLPPGLSSWSRSPSPFPDQPLPQQPPEQGPVIGWRGLDTSTPSAPAPSQPSQPTPSGGFLWKRIDED